MSLRGRLLLAIGYVLAVAIVAFEVPLAINSSKRIDSETRSQAAAQADLLGVAAGEELDENRGSLQPLVQTAARTVRGRVILVDASGRLIADSAGERGGLDYSSRPEVAAALGGSRFQDERESTDLGLELLATASPIVRGNRVVGAVRITQSTGSEKRALLDSIGGLALVGLIVLAIGLLAALVVARQLADPLRRMTLTAERIAAGDLDERVEPSGSSEQRALAHSFNEMTDRLAESLRSQRAFVADASHQLRTPLTGMRLRLEEARAQLLERSTDPSGAMEEIDAATGEVDRLGHTVSEMLILSRVGETRGEPEPLRVDALAAAAVERWEAEARSREITLSARGESDRVVLAPRADAERALDALVENALRYSPAWTDVWVEAGAEAIEVTDQGGGVDRDELGAIFERFHRGRAGRSGPKGTGLGLPIARALARSWGGDVLIEPADGGGTRARLMLGADPGAEAGPEAGGSSR